VRTHSMLRGAAALMLAAACRQAPEPGEAERPAAPGAGATADGGVRSAPAPVRVAACTTADTTWAAATGDDPRAQVAAEVCQMFARGAASWTRGDLDAFMHDYLPGEGTTYIGRSGVLHGPAAIRASYAPRFRPGVARDSLSFEQIEVDVLAPGVAHAIAYYVLSRGDSTVARGPTSLVLRKVEGRWLIVHDHSS
jgi:uncharacterized protein (TIGR02246 family)